METKKMLKDLTPKEDVLKQAVERANATCSQEELLKIYDESVKNFQTNTIIKGKVVDIVKEVVLVDIGYKSEGVVPLLDFPNGQVKKGDEIEVLLEALEDEMGYISLSKEKADKIRGWERILECNKEGDSLKGVVIKKIKGGLLVDVGVPVFLPSSQVDVERIEDIGVFVGKVVEVKILKLDEQRMNVIVSRRKFLEEQRNKIREQFFQTIKEGDIVEGVVKACKEKGAFVDVDGMDALVPLPYLGWGHYNHTNEVLRPGQRIQAKVIRMDRDAGRVILSVKDCLPDPWVEAEKKYQVGQVVTGRVIGIAPFGFTMEIEPGVEGTVKSSEISWTKKVTHPGEVVKHGQTVQAIILKIEANKRAMHLSVKQAAENPWDIIDKKYQIGQKVKGVIRGFTHGAVFIELADSIEGVLSARDISWTKKSVNPEVMFQKGQEIEIAVVGIDKLRKRLNFGLKQLLENPWETTIPQKYTTGTLWNAKVTNVVSFGAFVELEKDLEALIHYGKETQDKSLATGDEVQVKIESVDTKDGKITVSLEKVIKKVEVKPAATVSTPAAEGNQGEIPQQ